MFRYVAICHPFVHRNISHSYSVRRRVIFYTLPVIMISIVINLPKFLETKAVARKSSQPHLVNVSFLLKFFLMNMYWTYYENYSAYLIIVLFIYITTFRTENWLRILPALHPTRTHPMCKCYPWWMIFAINQNLSPHRQMWKNGIPSTRNTQLLWLIWGKFLWLRIDRWKICYKSILWYVVSMIKCNDLWNEIQWFKECN